MSEASTPDAAPNKPKRRRALSFLVFTVLLVAGVGGYLWWRHARGIVTDDAYIRADIAQVAPQTSGQVLAVDVVENQHVDAGDPLVTIDDQPYQMRVDEAQAHRDAAQADLRRTQRAAAAANANVQLARTKLASAERTARFQKRLVQAGSSVQEAAEQAADAVKVARAALRAAQAQAKAAAEAVAAAQARVAAARTGLELAERDLGHTRVRAPVAGIAAKVGVVAGDVVHPGEPLLAIVPDQVYVVANFKETDIADIHPGDRVILHVDAYADARLTGRVDSVGAATAAAFSLLPADNPSGNFVKVVQRVPVRIALDQNQVDGRPLAVGLSVEVRVPRQVHPRSGARS